MSMRNILSGFWNNIQYKLFPFLQEEISELSKDHMKLVSILELVRIENYLPDTRFNNGRPSKDRSAIARAFIAKSVFKFAYTSQLIAYLKKDEQLRLICGWESRKAIPSESKFSRAFQEFAESNLAERVHQALIKDVYKDEIVGHVSKDSTPVEAREKALKKPKVQKKTGKQKRAKGELNRREKQLKETDLNQMIQTLPQHCDIGRKKSAGGFSKTWKGYKLHVATDDHCVPLAAILTSASLNDCEVAIPLATKCSHVVTSLYDLMDAAYDHPEIKVHSASLGHIPIIDKCPTGKRMKEEKEAEQKRKRLLNYRTAEDRRYKERFKTERFNALYKDYYGGATIKYRGFKKVTCDVMFGVLALTGTILINLIQ